MTCLKCPDVDCIDYPEEHVMHGQCQRCGHPIGQLERLVAAALKDELAKEDKRRRLVRVFPGDRS